MLVIKHYKKTSYLRNNKFKVKNKVKDEVEDKVKVNGKVERQNHSTGKIQEKINMESNAKQSTIIPKSINPLKYITI